MLERTVGVHHLARLPLDKAVAVLAPGDGDDAVVVLHFLAAVKAAAAPQVLLEFELLLGHVEHLGLAGVALVCGVFAFELVLADVVFVAAALCDLHLAVEDGDFDIAALFVVRKPCVAVALVDFQVAHLDFGTLRGGAVLDDDVEPLGIVRGFPQEHAARSRRVLAAQVLRLLLEAGQLGALHVDLLAQLAFDGDETRRILRLADFPGDVALRDLLNLLLAVLADDFAAGLFFADVLDGIRRQGQLLDPVRLGKLPYGVGLVDFVVYLLINGQSFLSKTKRASQHGKENN